MCSYKERELNAIILNIHMVKMEIHTPCRMHLTRDNLGENKMIACLHVDSVDGRLEFY